MLKKTKSGIPAKELSLALAEAAKCGCGTECDCYGYMTLPNWSSVTGQRTDGYAIYIVDGEIKVDTLANAKSEIDTIKGIAPATSVTITGCPTGPVAPLATINLTAAVLPSNAIQTGVWASSNNLVATVSTTGVVTVLAVGTVAITFTSASGSVATCSITVED